MPYTSDPTHLGSDKLETGELTPGLILDDLGDLWVGLGEVGVKTRVLRSVRDISPKCKRRSRSELIGRL